jgi:hypothetical protein
VPPNETKNLFLSAEKTEDFEKIILKTKS